MARISARQCFFLIISNLISCICTLVALQQIFVRNNNSIAARILNTNNNCCDCFASPAAPIPTVISFPSITAPSIPSVISSPPITAPPIVPSVISPPPITAPPVIPKSPPLTYSTRSPATQVPKDSPSIGLSLPPILFVPPTIPKTPSVEPSKSTTPSQSSNPSFLPSSLATINTELFEYYTTPESDNWPDDETWFTELGNPLPLGSLYNNKVISSYVYYDEQCGDDMDGLEFIKRNPVCMIDSDCRYQFCNRDSEEVDNLPAYSVKVRTKEDLVAALDFANTYNIPVSMKTTGHSFTGSSILKDSLNLWMSNYEFEEEVHDSFSDSCGTNFDTTVSIGGGAVFDDVFQAVKDQYTLLSSDSRSVGFAGWLQGSALSHLSRYYGLGVDNILSFEVMLASGDVITADPCSHPELFAALQGGGGGTFGVVTQMQYQLYPSTKITLFEFHMDYPYYTRYYRQFLNFFTNITPHLDNRVAGAWFSQWHCEVYIIGDKDVARELFVDAFIRWYNEDFTGNGEWEMEDFNSWYGRIVGEDEEDINDFYNSNLQGRGHGPEVSSRLIPHDFVVNQQREVVEFLVDLAETDDWGAYWLGGKVNDVSPDSTSVHPSLREAIYSITTNNDEQARRLREFLPDTGPSFNHHSVNEPHWRTSLWGGQDRYDQLRRVKQMYDPQSRFTCYHCVSYEGPEYVHN